MFKPCQDEEQLADHSWVLPDEVGGDVQEIGKEALV